MIIIDMKMPQRCAECPCFSDSIYGHCNVKDIWLGADDGAWFSDHRPNWCPLQEQEAVKPYIDIDEAKCPICKVKLTRQELLGDDVLFEDFFDYCPHCGRQVKWE